MGTTKITANAQSCTQFQRSKSNKYKATICLYKVRCCGFVCGVHLVIIFLFILSALLWYFHKNFSGAINEIWILWIIRDLIELREISLITTTSDKSGLTMICWSDVQVVSSDLLRVDFSAVWFYLHPKCWLWFCDLWDVTIWCMKAFALKAGASRGGYLLYKVEGLWHKGGPGWTPFLLDVKE